MRSTFSGLETARRGMFTQQTALHVTGQNIANASTPGYSRQRVNFEPTESFPAVGMNRPELPGQMGTGVKAGSIQRVRDSFLDVQYRGENNKLGYWQTTESVFQQLEEVMNEPSETGLSKTMDLFWGALQDLATNPTNDGARSVVVQRGIAVSETFKYLSSTIKNIKEDTKNEIDVTVKEVNSLAKQLADINAQIADVEPHGYLPNDLYDKRDRLIDQLSGLVNVKVEYVKNSGKPLAEGQAVIKLMNDDGTEAGTLVTEDSFKELTVNFDGIEDSVKTISLDGAPITFDSTGKLQALIEAYGYEDSTGSVKGVFSNMLNELDTLAYTFASKFNEIHSSGWSPIEIDSGTHEANLFFVGPDGTTLGSQKDFAANMSILQKIKDNPDYIATADASNLTKGDAKNVLALADVINEQLNYSGNPGEEANFRSYYESIIGDMAVDSQQAVRLSGNSETLRQAVEERRLSVSSVSLDEEMTNMIQFQHAYNASARMITVVDEILNKIINGMGIVGR